MPSLAARASSRQGPGGGAAQAAKPMREAARGERLACFCRQESQVIRRMRGQDFLKIRVNRDLQNHAGLLLTNHDEAVADMLAPHADHVTAPLCGVQKQPEGEPRPRADWMRRLESRDLVFGPGSITAGRTHLYVAYAKRPNLIPRLANRFQVRRLDLLKDRKGSY
jgi:hypothetical protein